MSQVPGDILTLIWLMIKAAFRPQVLPWIILIFAVLIIGGWLLGEVGRLFGEPADKHYRL